MPTEDKPNPSVAAWFTSVANHIDSVIAQKQKRLDHCRRAQSKSDEPAKLAAVIEALNDIREDIHGLPGWNGEEPDTEKEIARLRAEVDNFVLLVDSIRREVGARDGEGVVDAAARLLAEAEAARRASRRADHERNTALKENDILSARLLLAEAGITGDGSGRPRA